MIIMREDWRTLVTLVALAHDVHSITDETIEYVLWERTCFPFGTIEMVVPQIHEFFAGSLG